MATVAGRQIRRAGLCGILLVCACGTLPQEAHEQVERAHQAYDAGRLQEAELLLSTVIERYSDHSGLDEAYYLRGLCRSQSDRLPEARTDLRRAADTKSSDIAARARAQLGHIAYGDGAYDQAAREYQNAVTHLPAVPPNDAVYFQYGDSLQKTGQWRRAREVLPKVWHLFPDSPLAEPARRKFSWKDEYFTIQCGAFEQPARASDLAQDLRSKHFEARVGRDVRSPAMQRVYVGRFGSHQQASGTLQRVRQFVPDALIVP